MGHRFERASWSVLMLAIGFGVGLMIGDEFDRWDKPVSWETFAAGVMAVLAAILTIRQAKSDAGAAEARQLAAKKENDQRDHNILKSALDEFRVYFISNKKTIENLRNFKVFSDSDQMEFIAACISAGKSLIDSTEGFALQRAMSLVDGATGGATQDIRRSGHALKEAGERLFRQVYNKPPRPDLAAMTREAIEKYLELALGEHTAVMAGIARSIDALERK